MKKARAKSLRIQLRKRLNRGFTLIESMVGLLMTLVIVGGLATLYAVSIPANTIDKMNVQILNSARAKIEQIQSIPYEQVGIDASGTASGPGYFVANPISYPVYSVNNGDILLSDTVTLTNGTVVTRTVTVKAVDDPADGTGSSDQDGITDPNTGTILDYKQVTVTASATLNKVTYTQTLSTFLQGSLDSEVNGATGTDANGATPPAPGKTPPAPPPAPPGAPGGPAPPGPPATPPAPGKAPAPPAPPAPPGPPTGCTGGPAPPPGPGRVPTSPPAGC